MQKFQFFTFLVSTLLLISCSDPKKTDSKDENPKETTETLDSAAEKGLLWYNSGSGKVLTPLKAAVDYQKLSDEDKQGAAGVKLAKQSKLQVASADNAETGDVDFTKFSDQAEGVYKLYTSFSFEDNVVSLPEAITIANLPNSLSTVKLIKAGVVFVKLNPDGTDSGTTSVEEALFETERSATNKFEYLFPAYNYSHIAYTKQTPASALSSIGSKTLKYKSTALISLGTVNSQVRSIVANKKMQDIDITVNMNSGSPAISTPVLELGDSFDSTPTTGLKSIEYKSTTSGSTLDQIIVKSKADIAIEYSSQNTKIIFGGAEAEEIGVATSVNLAGKILVISMVGANQGEEKTEDTGS